jgi:glycine/serine hydroxymethyltransferase
MGAPEMREIASLIARAIKDGGEPSKAQAISQDVRALTAKFPVYPR